MNNQRIYADLNKWEEVDGRFRVLLTTLGTHQDLQKYNISLKEGLVLSFWMDDEDSDGNPDPLYFEGPVHYNAEAENWFAVVVWNDIHNASELTAESSSPIISALNQVDTLVEYAEIEMQPSEKSRSTVVLSAKKL